MSILDLRKDGLLSIDDSETITEIKDTIGVEYNYFIEDFINLNRLSGKQLLTQATSRNTYVSLIYDSMCRLALLEHVLKNGRSILYIYIDNCSLKEPVEQLLNRYRSGAEIIVKNKKQNKIFTIYGNFFKNIYICLNMYIWSSLFSRKKKPSGDIIVLDTFILANSFDNKCKFIDRSYEGLIDNISSSIGSKVWYMATLSGYKYPWDLVKIFYKIHKTKSNIFIKEHWITLNDYIYAIRKSITLTNSLKNIPKWRGLSLSEVVKNEIVNDKCSNSITQAVLMYISIRRYKESEINIVSAIDWFENQTIDRGFYLGMREFFPNSYIKGYLGFVPEDYYIGIFPTCYENNAGIIPDELLVIGDAYVNSLKRFCPTLKVSSSPAFRFQNMLNCSRKNNKYIVIALPLKKEEAVNIINIVAKINFNNSYKLVIRPHPATLKTHVKRILSPLANNKFQIYEGQIHKLLEEARLLITSASSVAMEAVACGVYVAVIGNRSGPTINRLYGLVDNCYWSICYTSKHIEKLLTRDLIINDIDVYDYFKPVTSKEVVKMMDFNNTDDKLRFKRNKK